MLILGVDPGLAVTGYGVIESDGRKSTWLTSGCIRSKKGDLGARLKRIHDGIGQVIVNFSPQEVAIEDVFMSKNFSAALKLGQARGAAILSAANLDLPVFPYMPKRVKLAVTGFGNADKVQVQHMICKLLSLSETPSVDSADALAVAICHAHHRQTLANS